MRKLRPLAPVLFLLVPACGSGEDPRDTGEPEAPASAQAEDDPQGPEDDRPSGGPGRDRRGRGGSGTAAEMLEARPYDSPSLGALHGEIRVIGDVPERFPLGARKNKECTHHPDVEHLSDIVVARDGKLQYAYVYIKSGYDENAIPAAPSEPLTMDQRGCIYTPHVAAMQAGQRLVVRNSDPTNHNVNLRAPRNALTANVNMGANQKPLEYAFERREHKVSLKCDIHPWMQAWLFVQDHPWFAVSDEAGTFSIPDVPPGEYVVEAIHESFGKVRGSVTVEAGRSSGFALTFEAD